MEYKKRLSLIVLTDSLIVLVAIIFSSLLTSISFGYTLNEILITFMALLVFHHVFNHMYKLYKKSWRYASIGELIILVKTSTFSILCSAVVQFVLFQSIFIRLLVVAFMLHLLLLAGCRFFWRVLNTILNNEGFNKKRTLIVGAGAAGTMVARQLLSNDENELLPVAFIDDDPKKQHLDILGIPVAGGRKQLEGVVQGYNIEHIVIAIPSLSNSDLNLFFQTCVRTGKKTQTIPRLEDIVSGKVSVNQFRDVEVEDLLGREPVKLDVESISDYVQGKVILITGAGGSIGSEICRQVSKFRPQKLILLGHGENSIYSIKMEMQETLDGTGIEICTEIADIQDGEKMMAIMRTHCPNIVYHAAAHKHVPLMEQNPEEAVKNNVIGTMNVAQAASLSDVDIFVMISTDKAVNPTSVMGATKRLAEMIIQNFNVESEFTRFVAVRFGNVLGSRGSVIPLFKQQIQRGGPVTVTHPEMVRYFMTIPEASKLVLQAGALAKGGEIFVLDMGEPVKIIDLAKNLIRLSGNNVEEIGIQFTGMRPGEKLFEELLKPEEVQEEQVYPKIHVGKSHYQDIEAILLLIEKLPELSREEIRENLLLLSNGNVAEQKVAAL